MAATAEDLISEDLAKDAVGVSGNTLQRFAEAGYLKTLESPEGTRQYFKSELGKVFGIKAFKVYDFQSHREEILAEKTSDTAATQSPIAAAQLQDAHQEIEPLNEQIDQEQFARFEEFCAQQAKSSALSETTADTDKMAEYALRMQELETAKQELQKFKTISELQEKLLEARDSEIKDLKEQRSWLQERVEKMEEKATRDQLLLLTETQILTKMIAQREKKNPLSMALGWFGFTKDKAENRHN